MTETANDEASTAAGRSDLEGVVILQITSRELRLLEYATWRFMNAACSNHSKALQKRSDVTDGEARKMADAFWKDANDAKALVGKLRAELHTLKS